MRCRFVRKIFCNRDNGYCVFVFHTMEEIPKEAKDPHYKGNGRRSGPRQRKEYRLICAPG